MQTQCLSGELEVRKLGSWLGADTNLLHVGGQIIWFHGFWLPRRQWEALKPLQIY